MDKIIICFMASVIMAWAIMGIIKSYREIPPPADTGLQIGEGVASPGNSLPLYFTNETRERAGADNSRTHYITIDKNGNCKLYENNELLIDFGSIKTNGVAINNKMVPLGSIHTKGIAINNKKVLEYNK